METKKLYLEFANDTGDTRTISINDPKDNLDEITVREKADLIVGAGVFDAKGAKVTQVKKAYIREVVTTEII